MKKILTLLLLLVAFPAGAQNGLTYLPLGYCQLTSLTASTGLASCASGIPNNATLAILSVEGAAIRWRDDGTAPTSSVGQPVKVDQAYSYSGTLSALRIIQQSASATVNVSFYR